MKTNRQRCKEAAELLKFSYCNSIIAARTELSEREVEEIRQMCKIFVPVYKDEKKGRKK